VPLAFSCALLHILGLSNVGEDSHHVSNVVVFGVWPVLSIFLLWRIIRTIGPRVALAQFLWMKLARTKSLDFLVINDTPEDDAWIIDELLPIAKSGPIRIHRFLRGENVKQVKDKRMDKYLVPPIKTTYSNPEWNKVFLSVVENARSGSVIGVFFCGHPEAQLAVQDAVLNAMHQSIKNGIERNYDPFEKLEAANTTEKSAFGCNIRISVRAETGDTVACRTPPEKIKVRPT